MTTVHRPLYISSRLMAAVDVEGAHGRVGTLHVGTHLRDAEGRIRYRYVVENASGVVLDEGSDLRSGVGAQVDYSDIMATLVGFLGACAEAGDDGENADLFDADLRAWCQENSYELDVLGAELDRD